MSIHLMYPTSDYKSNWKVFPADGKAAWEHTTKPVTVNTKGEPTENPSTASGIEEAGGEKSKLAIGTWFGLAEGETVVSTTLWVFCQGFDGGPDIKIVLGELTETTIASAVVKAALASWHSITYTGSLTTEQLASLFVMAVGAKIGANKVYAWYIAVETKLAETGTLVKITCLIKIGTKQTNVISVSVTAKGKITLSTKATNAIAAQLLASTIIKLLAKTSPSATWTITARTKIKFIVGSSTMYSNDFSQFQDNLHRLGITSARPGNTKPINSPTQTYS